MTTAVATGVLILCARYIAARFSWRDVDQVFWYADFRLFVLAAGAATLLFWLIRSLRWQLLLRQLGVRIHLGRLYWVTAVSLGLTNLTPFQSGEVLKIELLRKEGVMDARQGYSSFLVERVADLAMVLLLGVVGGASTLADSDRLWLLTSLAAAVFGMFAVMLIAGVRLLHGRAGEFVREMQRCVGSPRVAIQLVLLTAAGWMAVAAAWILCLRSVAVEISLSDCATLLSAVTLSGLSTFLPGAVGIGEVTTVEFLVRQGYGDSAARAAAIILRGYAILSVVIGGLHMGLWRSATRVRQRWARQT